MENKAITFKRDSKGLKDLAIFLAQIVKEGLTYEIHNDENIAVTLTGGY